ncbi:MAG: chemotaxis-specific protein-glutamate methyltransferase CheB [Sphingopyxis sp.]|nr:chemotaxis-specific protein-glutamate methyltransferase CheB [Sphingopyxis sp.]
MSAQANRRADRALTPRTADRSIRVMLVDDSLVVRSVLERIIDTQPGMAVCASVASAADAINWLAVDRADVIILDIEMPGMSGITALPHILEQAAHARILILSSNCEEGGPAAIEALARGASDTLAKPGRGSFAGQFTEILIQRVRSLAAAPVALPSTLAAEARLDPAALAPTPEGPVACIAVAASTGGIPAFASFLNNLDARIAAPILLTQHLPDAFIPYYAQQIATASKRTVHVARPGMRLQPRVVYLAPGDAHLSLVRVGRHVEVLLEYHPVANGCCPSADPMFAAVAEVFGAQGVGIVLSGMGRDGAEGAAELHGAGGMILAQAPESCVVWGMPGAVANGGCANAVLNPDAMAVLLSRNAPALRAAS